MPVPPQVPLGELCHGRLFMILEITCLAFNNLDPAPAAESRYCSLLSLYI